MNKVCRFVGENVDLVINVFSIFQGGHFLAVEMISYFKIQISVTELNRGLVIKTFVKLYYASLK